MNKLSATLIFFLFIGFYSCSKKSVPEKPVKTAAEKRTDSLIAKFPNAPIKKNKKIVPKVITVNDKAATKSVDGRLYYDLEGHRYWRNKKDGKYYLFNKAMYDDPNFKP